MNGRALLRTLLPLLAATLALPASAASPSPATRESLLLTTAQQAICPGTTCTLADAAVEVKATVDLIVDKDTGPWDDTSTVPNRDFLEPHSGAVLPLPTDASKSSLTILVDFTHAGTRNVLTETYRNLGSFQDTSLDADCEDWCVPGWREPATEEQLAGHTNAGPVGVAFGWPGEALRRALNAALGLPVDAYPYFLVVDTVQVEDHSGEEDPLATVHRLKVHIKALVAAPL